MIQRVVYIGGVGRSGSTFLDSQLALRSDVFSCGEFCNLFEWYRTGRACTCGRLLSDCPVWSPVIASVDIDDRATSATITGDSSAHTNDLYVLLWSAVIDALGRQQRETVILDSSKTTPPLRHRGDRLNELGLDVDVIHIVRDPRFVIGSIMRGSNRVLEGHESSKQRRFMAIRAAFGWLRADVACIRLARRLGVERHVVVYEDLALDPDGLVNELRNRLRLDARPTERLRLDDDHSIAGNRARRSGGTTTAFAPNTDAPAPAARLLGTALWPLYAYHKRRRVRSGDCRVVVA